MPIHLKGQPGDVAPYVLLPGDPGRARHIAENFLDNAVPYTEHRGLLGFTGAYRGVPVSVQTTGMGCPSAAIVAEELAMLGAKVLLRVGTCGGTSPNVNPADLVIAQASVPMDGTTRQYLGDTPFVPTPSFRIVRAAADAAESSGVPHHVGLIASEDGFYASTPEHAERMFRTRGVLGLEMEASAVFTVASLRGMEAGCLTTVSNYIGDPQLVPDEVLRAGVDALVAVALETIVALDAERPLAPLGR